MVTDAFEDSPPPNSAASMRSGSALALGMTATEFSELAIDRNVIVIPGNVFSQRDTHFRISIAADEERLAQGLSILSELMR